MGTNFKSKALYHNFLGHSPDWYKKPSSLFNHQPDSVMISPFHCRVGLIAEFIFTLALALKCYPLQPEAYWH